MNKFDEKTLEDGAKKPQLRSLLAGGAALAGMAILAGRSKEAKAQDSSTLIPYLASIQASAKSVYDQAKKYQEDFNGYVTTFNKHLQTVTDAKNLTDNILNIDKIFASSLKDAENILSRMSKNQGTWSELRLKKLNIESIALVRHYKTQSNLLDDISRSLRNNAEKAGKKDGAAKLDTINLRKKLMEKSMRADATIVASKQRRQDFKGAISGIQSEKAKADAEIAASSVTKEELSKRLLEQQIFTNELLVNLIEIMSHGKITAPVSEEDNSAIKGSWERVEGGDFDSASHISQMDKESFAGLMTDALLKREG